MSTTVCVIHVACFDWHYDPAVPCAYERFPGEGQVDYVGHIVSVKAGLPDHAMSSLASTLPPSRRMTELFDSDHYPVVADVIVH